MSFQCWLVCGARQNSNEDNIYHTQAHKHPIPCRWYVLTQFVEYEFYFRFHLYSGPTNVITDYVCNTLTFWRFSLSLCVRVCPLCGSTMYLQILTARPRGLATWLRFGYDIQTATTTAQHKLCIHAQVLCKLLPNYMVIMANDTWALGADFTLVLLPFSCCCLSFVSTSTTTNLQFKYDERLNRFTI